MNLYVLVATPDDDLNVYLTLYDDCVPAGHHRATYEHNVATQYRQAPTASCLRDNRSDRPGTRSSSITASSSPKK